MFCDGTTICTTCHKRVPAETGLCQICGTILPVRTLANQPQESPQPTEYKRVYNHRLSSYMRMHYDIYLDGQLVA